MPCLSGNSAASNTSTCSEKVGNKTEGTAGFRSAVGRALTGWDALDGVGFVTKKEATRLFASVFSFCWFPVFFWPLLVQVARVMTSGKSIHQPGSARHQVGSAFLRRWWSRSNFPDYDLANIWGPRAAPPYEMLVQSFATCFPCAVSSVISWQHVPEPR